jgi:hypothetical protein
MRSSKPAISRQGFSLPISAGPRLGKDLYCIGNDAVDLPTDDQDLSRGSSVAVCVKRGLAGPGTVIHTFEIES